MDETYSIGLSLLDFVPVIAFSVGGYFLVRLAELRCGSRCATLLGEGVGLVLLGGTLKAAWKLLMTLRMGDYLLMSEAQFVLLAPGFLLMLIGAIQLVRGRRAVPAAGIIGMAAWKIPLLAVMTISSMGTYGLLSFLAFRRRQPLAGLLFIATIVMSFGMAGMASAEQTIAQQWLEEIVNSVSQTAMALASYLLYHRAQRANDGA